MTPAEFKTKWDRYRGKETSAYQEHFNDLCAMLGQPTPVEADPSGNDWFCFQKRVVKDLESRGSGAAGALRAEGKRGFADVWRKDCFGWEYKGKHADLDEAHKQLLRYRESLLNPPLLVTCDFNRFVIRTNFNGTVLEVHEFTNDRIDEPRNLRLLRALFEKPEQLRPTQTTAKVTEDLAEAIAVVARSLQDREAVELSDASNRREVTVSQKKNLRIARFLNRIVFCLFAEDTALLPEKLLHGILKKSYDDPAYFAPALESLFRTMATGGLYGPHPIRHFNGHLFEDTTVFELKPGEIEQLAAAVESDWRNIQPSIMGTLFERALEPEQRAQLGAHYTSETDIATLVEPVLMAPLRREWGELKSSLGAALTGGRGTIADRARLVTFQKKIAETTVLDPACGSGNFLYVALRLLLDLEKEVATCAAQLSFSLPLRVDVTQLRAIELNPYAYELAQVSVQIGALQWRRDNGYDNDRTPVLRTLDGFENKDALLRETFRKQPKNLKEARAEEHARQDELFRVYHERAWPDADIIVGNPPFLGDKLMRRELGDEYVEELRGIYSDRIPGQSDLCCYWFEKARDQIERGRAKRAGLLATQSIRGGAHGEVLRRIKETGDIFFAISDREWVLKGASVHVALIGFDDGSEAERCLDGGGCAEISSTLSAFIGFDQKQILQTNQAMAFIGTMKKGPLEIEGALAASMLRDPNPTGLPNSDVVRRWVSGLDISKRDRDLWVVDFPMTLIEGQAAGYARPFAHIRETAGATRAKHREGVQQKFWWRMARPSPDMRRAIAPLRRFAATQAVGKHRYFVWVDSFVVPDQQAIVFATEDIAVLGVLSSRAHEIWVRESGKQLREAESGGRYNITTCFETFPFPFPLRERMRGATQAELDAAHHYFMVSEDAPAPYGDAAVHRAAIGAAAKELTELRERWLNPPEWTRTEMLEFPASVGGPWDRFIDGATVRDGVGTARYPRLAPKDEAAARELKARTLTALYNERPAWLDFAHRRLDAVVAAAYGWPADVTDAQILERLLALNLARATREAEAAKAAALATKPRKAQRAKQADELV
ncbi:MAG: class I SAM-dependent DNA methyltransferase [Undibacterium sp.]|nr:class I SAM-dependent DNA methyltransferase [Opitutaceae bacterium]